MLHIVAVVHKGKLSASEPSYVIGQTLKWDTNYGI